MAVIPLGLLANPPYNNCQSFVDSMFDAGVRNQNLITSAYQNPAPNGYLLPADFTGGQMEGFTALWAAQWITPNHVACLPDDDVKLINLISGYIETATEVGPLSMWIPQIQYASGTDPAVFDLTGYLEFPFKNNNDWHVANVNVFLKLLASGAHFVAISANNDVPNGVQVKSFDQFLKSFGVQTKHDIGNSHYASLTNITGTYYLDINQDHAPRECGLILAFLAGQTVNNPFALPGTYNTFFQLEGWQAGFTRHNADYEIHERTLWNISTFGACAFSEKRACSVFLAPPGWTPRVYQITRMMPYVGAYANFDGTPQEWLNATLVKIPSDAPSLPSQFYQQA